MSIALLDVNVLVALFDPPPPPRDAHRWFARNRKYGWATADHDKWLHRILSNPAYPTLEAPSPSWHPAAQSVLHRDHHFWPTPCP